VFGFMSALKRMAERSTERYCARRKVRRARERELRECELREKAERELRLAALAAAADERPVIYSSAPPLAPRVETPAETVQADKPLAVGRPPWPGLTVPRREETGAGGATPEPIESAVVAFRSRRSA
jgi:hypothetical protein